MPLLSQYSLAGKAAILSTAGGDDGPSLAQSLAEAGASVFVIARRQETVETILAALSSGAEGNTGNHGGVAVVLDSAGAVGSALADFDRLNGKVDILVNDGRSLFAKAATEIITEEWDEIQSRNLRAAFLLSQAVGTKMIDPGLRPYC